MYFFRLLIGVTCLLLLFYYGLVILQVFGAIQFTNRKITFKRMLIPFYYLIADINEKSK